MQIPIPPGVAASYMVFDRDTGAVTSSHNEHDRIRSASLVKLMIALDYFNNHGADNPIPRTQAKALLQSMLRSSDDNAANRLWTDEGGVQIVARVVKALPLADTSPPADPNYWGYTPTSAADTVAVYRYILDSADATVRDFIMSNLHHATPCACDGSIQSFGIPSVISGSAYKQGWSRFPVPQNPCARPKHCIRPAQPRAGTGAAKDGPLHLAQALNTDVDLTSLAMHTTGTYANDRKIAVLLTLQPDNTDWDTSANRVTQLVRDIYTRTDSQPAGD